MKYSINNKSQNIYKQILESQFQDIKKYINYSRTGIFIHEKNLVYSKNPKISVIIALYNGELFINATLKSVQNQKMSEIEIIIIDDFSTDNSPKYIEQAKKIDPRIILLRNNKNMGCLYSKALALLKSKGKYIFLIDDDDLLVTDDLFDILFEEMEKTNIDIIEYRWIVSKKFEIEKNCVIKKPYCRHDINQVLVQPELRIRFSRGKNHKFEFQDRYIWGRIIKRDLYLKAIVAIGQEDLKRRIIIHDDTIITFFLFKFGKSFKKIDKIGLVHFDHNKSASMRLSKGNINDRCISYINYLELLFKHSENNSLSREDFFNEFKIWSIKSNCKILNITKERQINLAKQLYYDPLINITNKFTIKNVFGPFN